MLISITLVILAAVFVLLLFFLFQVKKTKTDPMGKGMALGGIAGMLIGIALDEFGGYEYPVPVIFWMLGMGGGQLIGWLYSKKK